MQTDLQISHMQASNVPCVYADTRDREREGAAARKRMRGDMKVFLWYFNGDLLRKEKKWREKGK